jgi:hypothetical protein
MHPTLHTINRCVCQHSGTPSSHRYFHSQGYAKALEPITRANINHSLLYRWTQSIRTTTEWYAIGSTKGRSRTQTKLADWKFGSKKYIFLLFATRSISPSIFTLKSLTIRWCIVHDDAHWSAIHSSARTGRNTQEGKSVNDMRVLTLKKWAVPLPRLPHFILLVSNLHLSSCCCCRFFQSAESDGRFVQYDNIFSDADDDQRYQSLHRLADIPGLSAQLGHLCDQQGE